MKPLPDLPSAGIRWALVALFCTIALLVYGASLNNGFVQWDDGLLIYQNPAVMEFSWMSVKRMFTTFDPELYIPFTLLSYQFDYIVGGGSAWMFHAQNLLLHTLNALLVMWLAMVLLRHRLIALLLGLLFLVHPLHTEAVVWASARKDVLSTFFFLSSLISFWYWKEEGRRVLYWLSVMLFAFGLMAKVMVITLPVVLLIFLWRENGKIGKKDLIEVLPHMGLSVVFGIVALFGKQEVSAASTLAEKLLMAGKSTVFYLPKLFWPTDFSVVYPYTKAITITSPDFFIPLLVLLALAVLLILSLKKTRDITAWVLLYFVTLVPTFINFAKGDHDFYIASDRYAYIPSIGILLIVGYFLVQMLEAEASMKKYAQRLKIFLSTSTLVLLVLTALSTKQSLVWESSQTLFEHAIAHAPEGSYAAHNNLGNVYRLQKDFPRAIQQYEASIALKPHAQTYSNLGATYRRQGQFMQAIEAYNKAIKLLPDSPLPYFGLGIVYAAQGRDDDAFTMYNKALEKDPTSAQVYTNIGALHAKRKETDQAIAAYQHSIDIDPYIPDTYYNLAVMYTELKRFDEAIDAYEHAIKLQPHSASARINIGLLYSQKGDTENSIKHFKAILKFDPDNRAAISALQQLGAREINN